MSALPEGWVETELGTVTTISSSKRIFLSDYVTSGIPFYRSKEVIEKQKGNEVSTELFITEEKFLSIKDKYGAPEKGDLLLTSVGTLGVPYLVQTDEIFYFKDGNLTWFRDYDGLDARFLYYFFLSSIGKERLKEITIGSTQAALTIAGLKTIPVYLPHLPEQKAIANMLSSFDEKIELLREQNKTLETLAQTIFKEWFVNFNYPDATGDMVDSELGEIPTGWQVGKLGDLIKTNAFSISKNSKLDVIQYLDTGSLTEGHIESTQELHLADAPSRAKRIVQHNDVLISTVRPNLKHYGIIKEPDENLIVSTGFCVITSDKIDPHFVYFLLTTNDMTDYLHSVAEGSTSTYPSIKPSDIESIEFVVPSENALKIFSDYADKAWNKIMFNQDQIKTLSKTRDVLLPKLMSGEIRTVE